MSTDQGGTSLHGGLFYDDETVFSNYTAHREWTANPNTVMEEPALLEALGDVRGARVLDLGCGDAELGRMLPAAGCASYHGIDSSRRMVERAKVTLQGSSGTVTFGTMEKFSAPPDSVDLVISRLALHYVEHIEPILRACHTCLVDSGRLVFTVTHPVITSHDSRTGEKRTSWVVDDYFVPGARPQTWMGGRVVWFHRTIEDYVRAVQQAGFRITRLSECAPSQAHFTEDPHEYQRRCRVPLFLLLVGEKT